MKIPKISDKWKAFEKAIIPQNAPSIQRQEMRRAFYAGCAAMFELTTNLGDDNISEEQGAEILDQMQSELTEFLSQVGKRY